MHIVLNAAFNVSASVGITKYLQRLAGALCNRCRLTILTPDPGVFDTLADTVKIPEWSSRGYGKFLWTLLEVRWRIPPGPDTVLLCPTPDTPLWPPLPTISVVHDLTPLIIPSHHRGRDKLRFLASLHTLRWAGAILTVSRNTARDLIRWDPKLASRVSVCYNGPGVLPGTAHTGFSDGLRPYILYVGGFASHKNLPRMISAFAALRGHRHMKLVLVGGESHAEEEKLEVRADSLGVADRLVSFHNLPDDVVSDLYRSAELLVYPSLYEGFGLPVLEALLHGTPVACSRSASLPEVAGPFAVYFDPADTKDITQAMEHVLAHAEAIRERISTGKEQLCRFSWNTAATKVLTSAECLLTSGGLRLRGG